jgi:hypothetical protein
MKPQSHQQILRYWVEIRELTSGSVRTLPLTAMRKISLARGKKNEPPPPSEDMLHLKDGAETWEAKTFDELRARSVTNTPTRHSSAPCITSVTARRRSGVNGRWTGS